MTQIKCCECNFKFETDGNEQEGYSSIVVCPKCKSLNSISHLIR